MPSRSSSSWPTLTMPRWAVPARERDTTFKSGSPAARGRPASSCVTLCSTANYTQLNAGRSASRKRIVNQITAHPCCPIRKNRFLLCPFRGTAQTSVSLRQGCAK
jgi:hypothetical protein